MKIYISGINGSGMSSLAHFCLDAGFEVMGSDMELGEFAKKLSQKGVKIHQSNFSIPKHFQEQINEIDYYIYTPSLPFDHPEIKFVRHNGLKPLTQNVFLDLILPRLNLKTIAVAGTHGKTTTTAMTVFLLQRLGQPVSYLIGSKPVGGSGGKYTKNSKFFVIEADEYAKKFLDLSPLYSIITNVEPDHPDIYPTPLSYFQAFKSFCSKEGNQIVAWNEDFTKLNLMNSVQKTLLDLNFHSGLGEYESSLRRIPGKYNRQNAWQVCNLVYKLLKDEEIKLNPKHQKNNKTDQLILFWKLLCDFPGTHRRQEKLATRVYTDYAHHPKEIEATLGLIREIMQNSDQE